MATAHGLTSDGLIALSDTDLLLEVYERIGEVEDDVAWGPGEGDAVLGARRHTDRRHATRA